MKITVVKEFSTQAQCLERVFAKASERAFKKAVFGVGLCRVAYVGKDGVVRGVDAKRGL